MSRYTLLVTLHIASVIVWLGAGTTLVLLTVRAQRLRDRFVLQRLGALTWWLTLFVLAPASLAAAGFGIAAAHEGHWPHLFWFQVGEVAFGFSFLLTVAVRLPLLRRAKKSTLAAQRLSHSLLALGLAELTVLYLAVADMVIKPSGFGTSAVKYGIGVLAFGFLAAAAIAYRARKLDPRDGMRSSTAGRAHYRTRQPSPTTGDRH